MVFGVPDSGVSRALGQLSQRDTGREALGNGFAITYGGEVENRYGNGAVDRGNSSLVIGC